jgi:predicted CXXCH cytochrome family protein
MDLAGVVVGNYNPTHPFFTGDIVMKFFLSVATLVCCALVAVQVSSAQITGTAHDMSAGTYNEVCVYCHTPHSQSATTVLWNRTASAATYTVYTSPTMEQTPGAPTTGISANCLSCHDGTVGYNSLLNRPGSGAGTGTSGTLMTGWNALGTDLSNDHPVHLVYNTSDLTDADLNPATLVGTKVGVTSGGHTIPLYGTTVANAYLECGSCHDPHDNTAGTFLRFSNSGSAVCKTCHTK